MSGGNQSQNEPENMPDIAYLSLGSNIGNRELNLRDAIQRLHSIGSVQSVSSIYETEPVEFIDQPMFCNCAVAFQTVAKPEQLMVQLLDIETAMGRQRIQKKGPRTIDIDVLLFGNQIVNTPTLTIPHPAMHQRRFVLQPLLEIAAEVRHPLLKKTTQELLDELAPGQAVRRVGTI